ncbi:CsbD family protein [Nocardioides sp. TRM66260-LWL]|uniref:CsbD family protein n=1 Tax=Nocardioides sp. TRM66260-LWL TaxID=2874478 RepID=UPI001CC4EADA|nr:CsbD family protein [Nocardioides sp. TRM66260-LWL]MBZ5736015.1 CsbD family protein [Nocardioides sp. TRM66260-LWL]
MGIADKISNKADDLAGKGKEAAGKATGDEHLENEGKADQAKASLKDGVEKIKDAASDVKDSLKK